MVGSNVVSNDRTQPIICIMGPTATGKTDAAAACFDTFAAEIISVDSSLVYRGMDIGTAKPDAEFLRRYPHQLVDVRDPSDTYSVADFVEDATHQITRARDKGRVPVLVGGTMFYFNALEKGMDSLPSANAKLRDQFTQMASAEGGWPALHEQLKAVDPVSAVRIDPNDAQRIQRALEIVTLTGAPVPAPNADRQSALGPFIKIGLSFSDRSVLHQRIALRFEQMMEIGLLNEVQQLLDSGVSSQATSMRMIGYRQILEFLQGDTTKEEAVQKGIAATRQLAKRQLTWMRNQSNLIWWVDRGLQNKEFSELMTLITQYLR